MDNGNPCIEENMEKMNSTLLVYFITVMQQLMSFKSNSITASYSAKDSTQCMNRLSTGVFSLVSVQIHSAVFSVQLRQYPIEKKMFSLSLWYLTVLQMGIT